MLIGCHSDDPQLHRGEEEPLYSDKHHNPVFVIKGITISQPLLPHPQTLVILTTPSFIGVRKNPSNLTNPITGVPDQGENKIPTAFAMTTPAIGTLGGMRVGCAGSSIPTQFAGAFPPDGSHLERYSRVLNCMEINSSFHRPHRPATWQRWAQSTPAGFRFSVKAPRTLTHEAGLACASRELHQFLAAARGLGEKLGPLLFQLPPKLGFDPSHAKQFFTMLRDLHPGEVACEARHPGWFTPEAGQLLKDFAVASVAADPARVPQAAHPGGWPGLVYYRLHGSPRTYYSSYSSSFLEQLASRIGREGPAGNSAWCIFDNTASGAAAGNALAFMEIAERNEKARIRPAV